MYPLRARRLALASLSMVATLATAQPLATSPGPHGLGSGLSWGLRSDYTPGLKWPAPESRTDAAALSDTGRASLYADWFPFTGNNFRVVGGLTLNDTWSGPLGTGQGHGPQTSANTYLLRPRTTTYLGVGYGSLDHYSKGLGFYADMGVSLGAAGETDAGQNGLQTPALDGWRTQNNGLLGFRYLPSVALGLIYRY